MSGQHSMRNYNLDMELNFTCGIIIGRVPKFCQIMSSMGNMLWMAEHPKNAVQPSQMAGILGENGYRLARLSGVFALSTIYHNPQSCHIASKQY
jgi:hypothetical protein